MGKFKANAVRTEDQALADEINQALNQPMPRSVRDYYLALVKHAYGALFEENTDQLQDPINGITMTVLGGIFHDNRKARDRKAVISRLASIENRFSYQWEDTSASNTVSAPTGSAAGGTAGDNRTIVLNEMKRVNTAVIDNIFSASNSVDLWNKGLPGQSLALKESMPIHISELRTNDDNDFFLVYINMQGQSLFLDVSEDNKQYRFAKDSTDPAYRISETFRFSDKVNTSIEAVAAINQDPANARYLYNAVVKTTGGIELLSNPTIKLDPATGLRSVQYAINFFEAMRDDLRHFGRASVSPPKRKYNLVLKEAKVLELAKTTAQSGKPRFTSDEVNQYKDKWHALAWEQACMLPNGYKCFYHNRGGNLEGYLSSVNIGEGRGGGSYAMRADPMKEVDYRWGEIAGPNNTDSSPWFLQSILELDTDKTADTLTSSGFLPTNWPYDRSDKLKTPLHNTNSFQFELFHYSKRFLGGRRKNKPNRPISPRTTNPKFPSSAYQEKSSFKLDSVNYRKWQKGPALAGVTFALSGEVRERASAGLVMAKSLSDYTFFADLKRRQSKVKDSHLPATEFAHYVINNDQLAKAQWMDDNHFSAAQKASIAAGAPLHVSTDQEWCHLLGHGDGGEEVIENFVSGSKHCNTEQLAIETGLRRVTQNTDINLRLRQSLQGKITAYLMPNQGSWTVHKDRSFELAELRSALNPDEYDDSLIELFFNKESVDEDLDDDDDDNDSSKATYQLKDQASVEQALETLNTAIKAKNDQLGALLHFRQNLKANFFTYYPLARWMRYKIYSEWHGRKFKILDHTYDAQSQSMDFNECQILDYTVERALYHGLGLQKDYEKLLFRRVFEPNDAQEKLINLSLAIQRKLVKLRRFFEHAHNSDEVDIDDDDDDDDDAAYRAKVEANSTFKRIQGDLNRLKREIGRLKNSADPNEQLTDDQSQFWDNAYSELVAEHSKIADISTLGSAIDSDFLAPAKRAKQKNRQSAAAFAAVSTTTGQDDDDDDDDN